MQLRRPAMETVLSGPLAEPLNSVVPDAFPNVLVVGATARFLGGGAVKVHHDAWHAEHVLAELASAAAMFAVQEGRLPVALFLPHNQVPSFLRAWSQPRMVQGGLWSTIELKRSVSKHEFLSSLDKRARYTWKQDERARRESGLRYEVRSLDDALIDEAAPLITDVASRNGALDSPMLASFRARKWRETTPGEHFCLEARDRSRLVGACFARVHGDVVDAYEIGLVESHPHRHTAYAALAFHLTLELALSGRRNRIELGVGHAYPKRNRGATQTRLWHIFSVPVGIHS